HTRTTPVVSFTPGNVRPKDRLVMSESSPAIPEQVFYRYDGPDGNVVLVDSLDKLPPDVRPKAKRLVYEGSSRSLQSTLTELLTSDESPQATTTSAAPIALTVPEL